MPRRPLARQHELVERDQRQNLPHDRLEVRDNRDPALLQSLAEVGRDPDEARPSEVAALHPPQLLGAQAGTAAEMCEPSVAATVVGRGEEPGGLFAGEPGDLRLATLRRSDVAGDVALAPALVAGVV